MTDSDLRAAAVAILDSAPAPDEDLTAATIVGIGWATVEADRAVVELGGTGWTQGPRDPLLGARTWLRPALSDESLGEVTLLILEPDTEGRLAALLARFGEGVAAVYLRVAGPGAAGRGAAGPAAPGRAAPGPSSGPLGTGHLVRGGPSRGPHLIVLEGPS